MSMQEQMTEATVSALSLSLAFLNDDIPAVRQAMESMDAAELRRVLAASTLATARYAATVSALIHGDTVTARDAARAAMRDTLNDLHMRRYG